MRPKGVGLVRAQSIQARLEPSVKRKANESLTTQIVAAEHFAQVMRQRRPVAADAKPLATLVTGAVNSVVKAEKSVKARALRKHQLDKLEGLS